MKKSYLWTGLGMIVLGMIFLAIAIFWDTPLSSLLCGFSGAFIGPGLVQVYKYVKWTRLETADSLQRYLEEEQINLRDERKEMLRNKSGRYAYILGLLLTAAAILTFSALGKLGMVGEEAARLMLVVSSVYLLVQYAAGLVIYQLLERKY